MTLQLGQLAGQLSAPIEDIVDGLYRLALERKEWDKWAVINSGCSPEELSSCEERIGYQLDPLHRFILSRSNGGTIPFVVTIAVLAAAVPREREWRSLGFRQEEHDAGPEPIISARQAGIIYPELIGRPIFQHYSIDDAESPVHEDMVFVASGFGGERWAYLRNEPQRIGCAIMGLGRLAGSQTFEAFIASQLLHDRCERPDFIRLMRVVMSQRQ